MAEWKILFDAIDVRLIDLFGGAQRTAAFGTLGREQMPFASAGTHDFTRSSDFEPLGYSLARLNSFWASHRTFNKNERGI